MTGLRSLEEKGNTTRFKSCSFWN